MLFYYSSVLVNQRRVPLQNCFKKASNKPEVVVITPSRDSASDIFTMASELVQETELKVVLASGETSLQQQIQELKEGCNILIATPGRLLFLARGLVVSFQNVKVLVLNEAQVEAETEVVALT